MADALDQLDRENRQAWRIFRAVATRFTADVGCGNEVLRRCTAEVSDDDWPDLWRRLVLLYDVCCPPKPVT